MNFNYKTNKISNNIREVAGFTISSEDVVAAINYTNNLAAILPKEVFTNIDFKATSGLLGACFCAGIEKNSNGSAIVNPIEKGYPDIIPVIGKNATDIELMNYPLGLEVKCTAGNTKQGVKLKTFEQRINDLSGITWQAHHREGKQLLGLVWDFPLNGHTPVITGAFYTNELTTDAWGNIAGTSGRNTKVSAMVKSGKQKMGKGWIAIIDLPGYKEKYIQKLS